jgi:hypothetical protein
VTVGAIGEVVPPDPEHDRATGEHNEQVGEGIHGMVEGAGSAITRKNRQGWGEIAPSSVQVHGNTPGRNFPRSIQEVRFVEAWSR